MNSRASHILLLAVVDYLERRNAVLLPQETPFRRFLVDTVYQTHQATFGPQELLRWAVATYYQGHSRIAPLPFPLEGLEVRGTGRKQAQDFGGWKGTLARVLAEGFERYAMDENPPVGRACGLLWVWSRMTWIPKHWADALPAICWEPQGPVDTADPKIEDEA